MVGGIDAALAANGPPVEWGLRLIGSVADSCNTGALEAAVAPNDATSVKTALGTHTAASQLAVTGNRPTRAALNAATTYLLALTSPGSSAILLMTDGQPNCDRGEPGAGDVAGTVEAIAAAWAGGFPTFVVGIGTFDAATDDVVSMMAIQGGVPRGGTPAYYPVADATDVERTISQVVEATGACTFAIPPPPTSDGVTSREDISVFFDIGLVPQDASHGWTYGDSTHTTVTLHGSSCGAARAGHQLMIEFRCSGIP